MPDQVIEDIKNKLDIVDVLSGYMQLKRSGTNFKAVCPFHSEKTPSLMVSPQKQIWHCFGCNEGGDIFGFVMRMENLEFREALKLLADRAGVLLPERSGYSKQTEDLKDTLLRINRFAAEFYHRQLFTAGAKVAQDYLKNRGLTEETIKKWQIGYAPGDYHALEKALLNKGVNVDHLVKAGVSVKGDKGNVYDRFRNRITFPIYNYMGDCVGFTARVLDANDTGAKYINSPETVIYNKSAVLFGLNFAKSDIRKNDNAIIVEGQMDCITCHEAGFNNVVASSGTALTEQQVRLLGRLTKNLKFCFDADSAGQTASRKAGELALSLGFAVKVVHIPSGKDPEELISKDINSWKKALKQAVWFIDFYIERGLVQFPSNSLEQKKYVSKEIIPLLHKLTDQLEADHYIKKIAEGYGITEQALREEVYRGNKTQTQTVPEVAPNASLAAGPSALEKEVFGGLLFDKEFFAEAKQVLGADDFVYGELAVLVGQLFQGQEKEVKEHPLAKEAQFMVESELDLLGGNSAALSLQLRKNAYMLRLLQIKREQEQLSGQIRTAEQAHDAHTLQQLNQKFSELLKQRLAFENKINQN